MARVLVLYAHPGHQHSQANLPMAEMAAGLAEVTFVDLYARYPRYEIDTASEQQQLAAHDVVVLQFPLFWSATPALLKEWFDLVLTFGFAFGPGGDKLCDKVVIPVISTGGDAQAFTSDGYQRYPLREFLRPLEQTAHLCQMQFSAPYVLYGALKSHTNGQLTAHVQGYRRLLLALASEHFDIPTASACEVLTHENLDQVLGAGS